MALHAYFPPFLSDLQQAQIAFYEFPMPFEPKVLEGPASLELARLWPMRLFPPLV